MNPLKVRNSKDLWIDNIKEGQKARNVDMTVAPEVSEWVQREVETDRRSSSSVGRPTETRNENTNELIACVLACLPHRERFETEPAISLLITSGKPGPAGRPALWSSSMVWSRGRKRGGRQPIMSHSHRRTYAGDLSSTAYCRGRRYTV